MRNTFTEYLPNYYSGYDEEKEIFNFDNTEELLNHPLLKKAEQYPTFSHFVVSEEFIMLIADGGHYWQVIGKVKYPELVELPQWQNNKKFRQPKFEQIEYSYPMIIGNTTFKIFPKKDGGVNIKYGTIVDENDALNFDKMINVKNFKLCDIDIKIISKIIENL